MRWPMLALTMLVLILSSCVGALRQESPDRQSFALEVLRTESPLESPAYDGGLAVLRFSVAPAYGQRNLVYRMSTTRFESDYYNLFLIDPGEIITQETRKWLTQSNLFQSVTIPGSRLDTPYSLEGHVLDLYGDFTDGRGAAVLAMHIFLVRDLHGQPEILLQQRYGRRVALVDRSPDGLVRGYNEALSSILSDLERDLRRSASDNVPGQ
jgi:cholesterol transport system auxiliary component